MLVRQIIKGAVRYILLALAIMCFPWLVTLAIGSNSNEYIYETSDSGRYVITSKGTVDAEDFTAFVLASQMSMDTEEEALKAQAVIIRTYLYKMMEEAGVNEIKAEDTGYDYKTYEELKKVWGDEFPDNYNKLMKAVDNTAMLVITCDNKLITPYYHSVSGGYTRDGAEVLGEEVKYLRSVQSSKDVESEDYLQGAFVKKENFVSKLREAKKDVAISDEKPLETFQIISRCQAGYITSLQIGNVVMTGDEFAHIFNLKSPNFKVEEYEGGIRIITKGLGHGLGLSIYGAKKLAETGKSFEEILKHYYTGVEIAKVTEVAPE